MKTSINLNKFVRIPVLSALVFMILYNVSFKSIEILTTGRIAVILLILWALIIKKNFLGPLRYNISFLLIFLPLPYVVAQYFLVADFGQLSRFLNLWLYSFIGASLIASLCKNIKCLIIIFLIAINIQSAIIFISFFSDSYRYWVEASIVSSSNYGADYIYRASGFSGSGGAALSLIQSLGVFFGWLLLRKNGAYENIKGKYANLVFAGMILSGASCILVGRTGTILSIVFLLIFIFESQHRLKFSIFAIGAVMLLNFLFFEILIISLDNNFSSEYFTKWAFGIFTGQDETIRTLDEQPIPPLSVETFFGTGLSSVVSEANPSGNDSGFVQAYYSMGLIFALIFFSAYICVLYFSLNWLPGFLRIVISAMLFLIEIKEPFVFKYSLLFIVLTLYFVHCPFHFNKRSKRILA